MNPDDLMHIALDRDQPTINRTTAIDHLCEWLDRGRKPERGDEPARIIMAAVATRPSIAATLTAIRAADRAKACAPT